MMCLHIDPRHFIIVIAEINRFWHIAWSVKRNNLPLFLPRIFAKQTCFYGKVCRLCSAPSALPATADRPLRREENMRGELCRFLRIWYFSIDSISVIVKKKPLENGEWEETQVFGFQRSQPKAKTLRGQMDKGKTGGMERKEWFEGGVIDCIFDQENRII